MAHLKRVVVLVDMDCFFCQVEEKLNPSLQGKPVAVVQYNDNTWQGGGIIAVNYPARDKGVTRHMRGNEARKVCPDIELVQVPGVRGKADTTRYREAGKQVAEVLQTFTPLLERASVDEAYLDITESVENRIRNDVKLSVNLLKNTHVVGCDTEDFVDNVNSNREFCDSNYNLAMGAVIVEEIREAVYNQTGYRCSAGIAHNKILAKLACGLHKPNKQTVLPQDSIQELYATLPVRKIKSLGGKFGVMLTEKLKIQTMSDLGQFSEKELIKKFDEKTGTWLYNIAKGIDTEPVTIRLVSKSIGCCKRFPGRTALTSQSDIDHWLGDLATELLERLQKDCEENNRKAKQMVVSFGQEIKGEEVNSTRSTLLLAYDHPKIFQCAVDIVKKYCLRSDESYCVTFLGISAGNFEEVRKVREITSFFKNMSKKRSISPEICNESNMSRVENNIMSKKRSISPEICSKSNASYVKNTVADTNNESDTSVYSKSTLEDDVDRDNLVYYDEINPKSVEDQTFVDLEQDTDNTSTNSRDSISQEINNEVLVNKTEIKQPSTGSFFLKYFENLRNFDTSKVLSDCEDDAANIKKSNTSEDCDMVEAQRSDVKNISDLSQVGLENNVGDTIDSVYVECAECFKKIFSWEFQSHMDYHFAIKIVKNEAHLYNNNNNDKCNEKKSVSTKSSSKNMNKSKKSNEEAVASSSKSLLSFLSKESSVENDCELMEMCEECNKKIKIEEMESHLDFHAAKKLHLEINGNINSTSNSTTKPKNSCAEAKNNSVKNKIKTINKSKIKKSSGNNNSIKNFLKQT